MDIQYGSSSSAYNRLHDVDCSSGDLSGSCGPSGPSGPPGSSRRELNAFLLRDYAFIRRRPIAGRSAKRSIASTMVRQLAHSAQVWNRREADLASWCAPTWRTKWKLQNVF